MNNYYNSLASGTAVQFLAEQLGNFNRRIEGISQDVSVIKQDTGYMKSQLNLLVTNLVVDISSIKKEKRDDEEKIMLIESTINESLKKNTEYQNKSEVYTKIVSNKINNWNSLDKDTKQFLTSAEYLFSVLQKIDKTDFSPCILEFSKALENELFITYFKPFIDIMGKKQNLHPLVFKDLENNKTRIFAQQVVSGSINRNLTLGQMVFVLAITKTPTSSYLLQEYSEFLDGRLNIDIIDNLARINESLRRKSAHPEIMDLEKAKEAKRTIPEVINKLLK